LVLVTTCEVAGLTKLGPLEPELDWVVPDTPPDIVVGDAGRALFNAPVVEPVPVFALANAGEVVLASLLPNRVSERSI
jgi:hypothetical protein